MQKFSRVVVIAALLGLFSHAGADELEQARKAIMERFDDVKAENVAPSPVEGMYRVTIPPQVFYMSSDGRYVVDGEVIDLDNQRNLTREYRQQSVAESIEALGEESMIVFGPDDAEHTVTVFTDIDCGYCRKLHEVVDDYNERGIRIRYLAYPRAGLESRSYQKAVSAWCADDQKAALTKAKQGEAIPNKSCDAPVTRHFELGQKIGVSGTPALVLESGQIVPGFVPPKRLAAILNGKAPN
ncbi:DsbC family protein [Thiohalophilus thiocyanatoxydans]|uniref:Thiol:disulfide interchange protein n=1 Tax=Thiohalophilus thiocyanatoxydans TaxID=381308 RepID=A0A4R8INF5_9GAMM|nr:DsbC family protein [Thiohalophilus thiocyanatoxydans]TDY02402.1 thiol:disulfide interchange protein DsbC [Thiohalophilus thiocyanatoxydans]